MFYTFSTPIKNWQVEHNKKLMFRSIGLILVLLVISKLLSGAFTAFENATIAVFETVEVAAHASQSQMKDLQSQ